MIRLKQKMALMFLLVPTFGLTLWSGERDTLRISQIIVPSMKLNDVHISGLVSDLQDKCRVIICTEDFAETNRSAFSKIKIELEVNAPTNLVSVLNTLVRKYPPLTWSCEDGVIKLRPRELANASRNPLNRKLKAVHFKGTKYQLVSYLASEIPDLSFGWGDLGGKDATQYEIDIAHETTIRGVLDHLSGKYGVPCNVLVNGHPRSPKPEMITLLIGRPSSPTLKLVDCASIITK